MVLPRKPLNGGIRGSPLNGSSWETLKRVISGSRPAPRGLPSTGLYGMVYPDMHHYHFQPLQSTPTQPPNRGHQPLAVHQTHPSSNVPNQHQNVQFHQFQQFRPPPVQHQVPNYWNAQVQNPNQATGFAPNQPHRNRFRPVQPVPQLQPPVQPVRFSQQHQPVTSSHPSRSAKS